MADFLQGWYGVIVTPSVGEQGFQHPVDDNQGQLASQWGPMTPLLLLVRGVSTDEQES